jgi:tartrate dehydratase alpha subunit/fumarate hydratase class I-like protein
MTVIREADVIASVADALQYISYYHTPDFIRAMGRAYDMEQSPSARDAIAQILTNSRMCAEGHRPICQDTGIVVVFVKVGMGVRWDDPRSSGDDQRRRTAGLSESREQAARVDRVRPSVHAIEYARQHAGGNPHRIRAGR